MKKWIKKLFTLTPSKRMHLAYWLGSFQMIIWYGFFQDLKGKDEYIAFVQDSWVDMHWGWWLAAWFLVIIFLARNLNSFEKETLWMTIKNPAKVTHEADEFKATHPLGPPPPGSRPRPPTAPPKPPHRVYRS